MNILRRTEYDLLDRACAYVDIIQVMDSMSHNAEFDEDQEVSGDDSHLCGISIALYCWKDCLEVKEEMER
jgi:hypothetical protein